MIEFKPLRVGWALYTDTYSSALRLSELLLERHLRYMPLYWEHTDARELLDALEYAQS